LIIIDKAVVGYEGCLPVVKKKEKRRRAYQEKRRDEESLYYILERDLDREAIFPHHDGWYSQVPIGARKRIDYAIKYGDNIYGIEVKKDFPNHKHFEQAEKYLNALNGIFLAYPSDGVGQAVYLSEIKESKFPNIGLISLTLFRSHIIRKAKLSERQSEQIWKDCLLDDKEYVSSKWELEQTDRLSKTILKDGCFWVSFNRNYKESDDLSMLPLCESDWKGLGLLYGASSATSLHKYFSLENLWQNYCTDLGWKSFSLEKLEYCGLANQRSYGNLLWMWALSEASICFLAEVRKTLRENLGVEECRTLKQKIDQWKISHKESQRKYEKEFMNASQFERTYTGI
jgi:hypothetical protein